MLGLFLKLLVKFLDPETELLVGLGQVGNGLASVEDGGVVLVAALQADDGK
jgi:hypothetical protein